MEEEVTCSLCMEVFTDPVSLPCGHGFCRGCLKSVVDHKAKTGEDISSDSAILPCPLCRAEVTLGPSGVDELQPNQDLSDLIQRRAGVKDSTATTPLCDMCESDNQKADRYCTNCMALYCERCLEAKHPRRGPFGLHRLMSMEQYLSEQTSHEADLKTSAVETDCNVANCKEHKQPLSLYCGTCERPICNGCMSGHDDHVMQAVSTAFTRNKGPLEEQVDRCRAIKTELEKLQAELVATQKDIQTKAEEVFKRIEANYEHALKSLQAWRKSERDKVDDTRDKLTSESLSHLKRINLMLEETDRLLTSSAEFLAGNQALFLLESKDLLERLKCNSTESNQELEDKRLKMTELRSALSRCDFRPCALTSLHADYRRLESPKDNAGTSTQTESVDRAGPQDTLTATSVIDKVEGILTPQLKFTDASKPGAVIIGEEGMTVTDKPGGSARRISVRTDGLLSQCQYWEVAVSWRVSSPPPPPTGSYTGWVVCTVGVRQERSDFSSRLGDDPTSYGVEIIHVHKTNSYCFDCMHQGEVTVSSKEQVLTDDSVNHHFGFLLQTRKRTLTVIDLGRETRLHTFRELDVSRPFVPVVRFGTGFYHRSFRLIPADSSVSLTRVLDIANS